MLLLRFSNVFFGSLSATSKVTPSFITLERTQMLLQLISATLGQQEKNELNGGETV